MNMDLWILEQIATRDKKAMPLLSYPAVQQLFITVDKLVNSSTEMALGVRLIATRMDRHTGEILGKNCHDHEKVTRFYREYPGAHVDRFASDSYSDSPMARIADAAVLVLDRENRIPWPGMGGKS